MSEQTPPTDPDMAGQEGPAIGQDEWVARHGERRAGRAGWMGEVEDRLKAAPWYAWLILFAAAFSLLPVVSDSGYIRRVAFDTALYMLLALGLNVVVGWGGLLDLGYVAFYGVGAYAYAMLDSGQLGVHLPTFVAIPLCVIIGAVIGFLVGLPSRRLVGDYLAIVTLFFLQIFLTVATNGNSIGGHNLTGGANGILLVDPLHLFGHNLAVQHQGVFAVGYLYAAIVVFAVVYVALHFVNHSRTGRAWRSIREDPLAAEAMGMPVNLLKLLAFSFGAGVAALTGTLFASLNASVFPLTFSFPLLITVYTMVILGGQGSQAGVVVGAVLVSVLLETLRDPGNARLIFYAFGILAIVLAFGRSRRLAGVLASTLVFGLVVHAVVRAMNHDWVAGTEQSPNRAADILAHWVVVPTSLASWVAPFSYIGLIGVVLMLTLMTGWLRLIVLVPTLYLAAFVWENVLLPQPDTTRYIVLGAMLIALMIMRPNGLFGERRVEIV
jgi:branched-chain amino acid transport system permease protein